MPLEPMTRTCPGGAPAVWRSEDGGDSWQRLARGFPKKDSFFTVQRDAMDIDELKSPALYFGTTTGQLWVGRDGGEEWSCLFDSLPPIHCVKVAVVRIFELCRGATLAQDLGALARQPPWHRNMANAFNDSRSPPRLRSGCRGRPKRGQE